jgi:hypothetical protein
MPAGCRFAFGYPEFGTYEPMRVVRAMRSDNWLHVHGDPGARSDPTTRAIKDEILETFRPADAGWQRTIVRTGATLVEQALARLPGAFVRESGPPGA